MAATDELRLKTSAVDYQQKMSALDDKMNQLQDLLSDYQSLKNDAVRVLGDGDTNLAELQHAVNQNIQAVQGQFELLKESKSMLVRQSEKLEELSGNVGDLLKDSMQTAKTAFDTFQIVGNLVN